MKPSLYLLCLLVITMLQIGTNAQVSQNPPFDVRMVEANDDLTRLTKSFICQRQGILASDEIREFIGANRVFRNSKGDQCICGETRVDLVIQLSLQNSQLWVVRRFEVPNSVKNPLYAVFLENSEGEIRWMQIPGVSRFEGYRHKVSSVNEESVFFEWTVATIRKEEELVLEAGGKMSLWCIINNRRAKVAENLTPFKNLVSETTTSESAK